MTDVAVALRPYESQQDFLNRFGKKVEKSGLLRDAHCKRWFVSKSEQRRLARKKAARREQARQKA